MLQFTVLQQGKIAVSQGYVGKFRLSIPWKELCLRVLEDSLIDCIYLAIIVQDGGTGSHRAKEWGGG